MCRTACLDNGLRRNGWVSDPRCNELSEKVSRPRDLLLMDLDSVFAKL